jgi:hypothetical protein
MGSPTEGKSTVEGGALLTTGNEGMPTIHKGICLTGDHDDQSARRRRRWCEQGDNVGERAEERRSGRDRSSRSSCIISFLGV